MKLLHSGIKERTRYVAPSRGRGLKQEQRLVQKMAVESPLHGGVD